MHLLQCNFEVRFQQSWCGPMLGVLLTCLNPHVDALVNLNA